MDSPRFSLFQRATHSKQPTGDPVTLAEVHDRIVGRSLAAVTKEARKNQERVRAAAPAGRKAAEERKKGHKETAFPAITPAGVFNKRTNAGLAEGSGCVVLDFDDVPDAATLSRRLAAHPATCLAFVSPSGAGAKAIVRVTPVPTTNDEHGHALDAAARVYEEWTGCAVDPSGRDVARLCFLAHDPHATCNPQAEPVPWDQRPPPAPARSSAPDREVDQEWDHTVIREALDQLDPCSLRTPWITVGAVLHAAGLPFAVWRDWSARCPEKFDEEGMRRDWDGFQADRPGGAGPGTIIYLAKQAGWRPPVRGAAGTRAPAPASSPLRMSAIPMSVDDDAALVAEAYGSELLVALGGTRQGGTRDPDVIYRRDRCGAWTPCDFGVMLRAELDRWSRDLAEALRTRRLQDDRPEADGQKSAKIGGLLRDLRSRGRRNGVRDAERAFIEAIRARDEVQRPNPRTVASYEAVRSVRAAEMDVDLSALVCTNGIVSLRTGEVLSPAEAEELWLTTAGEIPHRYVPGAEHPDITALFAGMSAEDVDYIGAELGHSLHGQAHKRFLVIAAESDGGKSTFGNAIRAALGRAARYDEAARSLRAPNGGGASTLHDAYALYFAAPTRLVFCDEAQEVPISADRLSGIVGGGVAASPRDVGEKVRETRYTATPILAGTSAPQNLQLLENPALRNRCRPLPWPSAKKRQASLDKGLAERVTYPEQREAMLAWLVGHARRNIDPPAMPPAMVELRESWAKQNAGETTIWIKEHVVKGSRDDVLTSADLWEALVQAIGTRPGEERLRDGTTRTTLPRLVKGIHPTIGNQRRLPLPSKKLAMGWRGWWLEPHTLDEATHEAQTIEAGPRE